MNFDALAERIASSLDDVRACLLMSSDGFTLGAFPDEGAGREAWHKLEAARPRRGFLEVSDAVWVVAQRGPYAAVVVAAPTVRPGVIIDHLDTFLRVAEE